MRWLLVTVSGCAKSLVFEEFDHLCLRSFLRKIRVRHASSRIAIRSSPRAQMTASVFASLASCTWLVEADMVDVSGTRPYSHRTSSGRLRTTAIDGNKHILLLALSRSPMCSPTMWPRHLRLRRLPPNRPVKHLAGHTANAQVWQATAVPMTWA